MAIAVDGGHVSRALDFYDREGKYFIIGGSTAWTSEPSPDTPHSSDFKLKDVIGLKKVDNIHLVVKDSEGTISYRDQNWRKVPKSISTYVGTGGIASGSKTFTLNSVESINIGSKLRVNNTYEGTVTAKEGTTITLDTAAPATIPALSPVIGGALVEGAKYVYVEGYLNYNEFPLVTYRQIGLCSGVIPKDEDNADVLKAAAYSSTNLNEYESLGVLEILDNRSPIPRDINMRELISMIIEF